jgi:hypothetical protein
MTFANAKPSSFRIYRDSYLVEEPPANLGEAHRDDLDRLETALRLYDAAAPPARRLSVSAYYAEGSAPSGSFFVSLMEGSRGVGVLTAGTVREAVLICDALGFSEDLSDAEAAR